MQPRRRCAKMGGMARGALSRRQFLTTGLRAASTFALLPLLADKAFAHSLSTQQPALSTPVRVRVGELVQESRADFAAGQLEGLELPRAGGESGLTARGGGGVFTSAPLATEFEARHVGVHWLSHSGEVSFELRTSLDGARWSRWQRVWPEAGKEDTARGETFGALLGGRGARFLQYRATFDGGARPVVLQRVALTYLDARSNGRLARSGSFAGLLAGPADFRSQIIPREEWGADESLRFAADGSEIWPRAYVPAKKVVVHHTATTNDYADGAEEVRAIYTYHAQTLGWGDIGYNSLIDNTGRVYEGRRGRDQDPESGPAREIASRDVVAGHATPFNYGTTAIALIGNFQEAPLPDLMRERLEEALVFECGRHGVDPRGRSDYLAQNDFWRDELADVPGHRDCTPTECPGDFVYGQLPDVRRSVAQRLALDDRPRAGPVALEQGRNAWPGSLDFSWQGPPGAEFSVFFEGWFRVPEHDEIVELSGYQPGLSLPAWGAWSRATSASFQISPESHGHYTLHVRARTAPGVESLVWSRASALVEPQVPVDNSDPARTRVEGEWPLSTEPASFYGRDFAYTTAGTDERVFRWRLTAPRAGRYAVQACWPVSPEFATAAPFTISVDGRRVAEATADQTAGYFAWQTLGELDLTEGQACEVALSNAANGNVVADAVRLLLV